MLLNSLYFLQNFAKGHSMAKSTGIYFPGDRIYPTCIRYKVPPEEIEKARQGIAMELLKKAEEPKEFRPDFEETHRAIQEKYIPRSQRDRHKKSKKSETKAA
jgi:hypothetical protein